MKVNLLTIDMYCTCWVYFTRICCCKALRWETLFCWRTLDFLFSPLILLLQAVEESLKSVNLFNGGVADKQAGKYSGGMKRRLSVAISLIGDPKVSLYLCSVYFATWDIFLDMEISCCSTWDLILGKFSRLFIWMSPVLA